MVHKTRHEAYQAFVQFVSSESQAERTVVNRRMFSVFLWCFAFPGAISAILLVLVRLGVLPFRARLYVEWLFLIFPVSYSLYFLAAEVLRDLPEAFRKGGMAGILRQCDLEGAWREKMVEKLRLTVHASHEEWQWIVSSFRMDIDTMRYRTRFLTALAGAVFFIITQGLDVMSGEEQKVTYVKDQALGWVELSPSDTAQWAGLVLFLVLLYLSGSQSQKALSRYLNCAELALQDGFPDTPKKA